ncbi:phage tail tape measure protein [Streptomyces sp. NPDC088197]|uniref:phage tail tape measure protein n=1 Tax=Streptomyces sp. NPDC088197 TaxID=3365840 RepID=UPI0037FF58A6
MTANVGYASLQIIPSVRGIAEEIRRQLAPAAGAGEHAGGEAGRGFGAGFRHLLEAAGVMTAVEKITEGVSEAFSSAIEQSGMPGKLKAQLGTTAPVAAQYGKIAGGLYAGAITDSVETAAENVRLVAGAGLLPPGATQAQIKSITTQFSDFTSTFEQDSGLTAQAVSAMIKNGLAKDGTEAIDLLTRGFQKFGPQADDLVETFQEYPVQLRKLGLSGQTALGLISQGLKGGARDTDIITDALKEFSIRAIDGSTSSAEGYKLLGLSATKTTAQIAKGGTNASKGLQTVLDRLRAMKDPVKQAAAATALFGTQSEDAGRALLALDPSKATKGFDDFRGAANQMGTDLRDNAGARLTAFTRSLKQGLVNVIGGQVLPRLFALGTTVSTKVGPPLTRLGGVLSRNVGPAMDRTGHFITGTLVPGLVASAGWVHRNATALGIAGGVITAVMLPVLVTLAVSYATAAAAAVASGAAQVASWVSTGTTAVGVAALEVAASYRTVGGWIASGAAALAGGARVVAGWVLSAAAAAAGAAGTAIAVAGVVAGWVIMGVQSLFRAAQMAAAWLIALGPIGWVTIAVVAIVALIIANWSKVSSWTVRIWHDITAWVTGAVSAVIGFVRSNWPLLLGILTGPIGLAVYAIVHYWSQISGAFSAAYRGTVATGRALVTWVTGLPGRIASGLASLGARVYSAAVSGFGRLKSGASAKAAELLGYVSGLPGQIKSRLGSLGGLLTSEGRNIITGLWSGISSMGGWLASKVSGLVKSSIPGPIRKVLDMHSPSKVTEALGRFAGMGLVQGLTGTSAQVAAAAKKIADLVRQGIEAANAQIAKDRKALPDASKKQARALRQDIASQTRIAQAGTALAKIVAKDNAKLASLAKQRDGVAAKLKSAQDKLSGLQKDWTDLRDQIASGITSAASITREMPDGTEVTAATILARLKGDVAAARAFAAQLATLRKRGLSADLINEIGAAGVEGGGATAAALARASDSDLRAIATQQKALTQAATAAGTAVADAMYRAGIQAAQGLVAGLKAQQAAIERQMLAIAKSMQTAIRKALGIRSPSTVMARLMSYVGQGAVVGLDRERGRVDAAMRRLVAVPPAPQLGAAGARGGTGAGAPQVNIVMNAADQSFAEQSADLARRLAFAG